MSNFKLVLVSFITFCFGCASAQAEVIGSSKSSGFIFKDTITVHAEDDPDFKGVVCYTTDVEIGGPNLTNPSDSSIACRLVGRFAGVPSSRRAVFKRSKNPFFKRLVVDRFYDRRRNVLVYLSYTKKMSGRNASHSVSVVPLGHPLKYGN